MTLRASTWVLPEPALAETQADSVGVAARFWRNVVSEMTVMPLSSVIAITSICVHGGLPLGNPRQMVVFAAEIAGASRDGARQEASAAGSEQGPTSLTNSSIGLGSQISRAQELVAAGFFRIRIDALGKWLPAGQAEIEKPGNRHPADIGEAAIARA
jgi:hypothetical protein